jgi:hypothetical protein
LPNVISVKSNQGVLGGSARGMRGGEEKLMAFWKRSLRKEIALKNMA